MMYQYILFDLDGTITDSALGITNCVKYALKSFGIEEKDMNTLCRFIGPPLRDSFQEIYGFTPKQADEATEKYRERYREKGIWEVEVYEGVREMLAALKDAGKTVVLATSKPEIFAKQILENIGLSAYFDEVVGSELDGTRDKKEEVIGEVFRRLSYSKKEEFIMVGDRKFDIIGAKAWSVDSIGVTYGFAPEGELTEAGATYVVEGVKEIVDIVCG